MSRSPREQLVRIVTQLERLEFEQKEKAAALRDAFDSAKQSGYDTRTLKAVLRLRKLTPAERKEQRALEAIYLASLGMLEGDPLTDEARRRLDESDAPPTPAAGDRAPARGGKRHNGGQVTDADQAAKPGAPTAEAPPPAQRRIELKKPDEARQEGRDAAAAGARIYDNPFPAGDPCRAAWDEGWCEKRRSHGMDTPAAYQRRKPAEEASKPAEAPGEPSKAPEGPREGAGGAEAPA